MILTGESVICAIILFVFGKMTVAPLAEFEAFAYIYSAGGKALFAAVFIAVYTAAVVLCVLSAFDRFDKTALRIAAAVLIAADLASHAYVFLAARGYQWNYLISAVLDVALIVSVVYKSRENKADESSDEKGGKAE